MHRRQVAAFAQRNRARRHASKRSSKPSSQGLVLIVAERDTNELSTPLIIAIALPAPLLRTPGAAHSVRRSRFEKPASVRAGEVTEPHISRIWLFDYQVMRVSLRSWDQLNHGSCCPTPEVRRATSLQTRPRPRDRSSASVRKTLLHAGQRVIHRCQVQQRVDVHFLIQFPAYLHVRLFVLANRSYSSAKRQSTPPHVTVTIAS